MNIKASQQNMSSNILILGATGFIGGTILDKLLQHPDAELFKITILVRSAVKAEKIKQLQFGVQLEVILGSTEDTPLLEKLVANSDVSPAHERKVISTVLAGLKQRFEKTAVPARLFQVSGTSILGDGACGMHATSKVYTDMNISPFIHPPLPEFKPYAFLARDLVDADNAGYVKSYLIPVPLAYGLVKNQLTEAGIQNNRCFMLPVFVKAALARGRPGFVGKGLNISGCVHVSDLADLFLLLYNTPDAPHGQNGVFFAQPAEYTRKELAQAIGEGLVAANKVSDDTPTSFTVEELDQYFPRMVAFALGNNVQCTSDRSYSVGWKPAYAGEKGRDTFLRYARDDSALIANEEL